MEERDFTGEFEFITSRSGGAGGQNVNKVSTKVLLCFNIEKSALLSEFEKKLIREKLSTKINSDGILQIVSQSERTQLGNKEVCIQKFHQLIKRALIVPKKRRKTAPSKASIEKRLENKRKTSTQKQIRKKIDE